MTMTDTSVTRATVKIRSSTWCVFVIVMTLNATSFRQQTIFGDEHSWSMAPRVAGFQGDAGIATIHQIDWPQ